jgi:hypothetical protein
MLLTLSDVLDVPLRERNFLLLAARYAPVYRETSLDALAAPMPLTERNVCAGPCKATLQDLSATKKDRPGIDAEFAKPSMAPASDPNRGPLERERAAADFINALDRCDLY